MHVVSSRYDVRELHNNDQSVSSTLRGLVSSPRFYCLVEFKLSHVWLVHPTSYISLHFHSKRRSFIILFIFDYLYFF
jgi:hypothetical protein